MPDLYDWHQAVTESQQNFDNQLPQLLQLVRQRGGQIHCRDRCSNCCGLAVFTTYPEAASLARQLSPSQQAALDSYMQRLQLVVTGHDDLRSFLRIHQQLVGKCPFLVDDSCSCYAHRPLSCRALLSTRPADWCGVNLSELHPLEQQAFLSSLDQQLVDYPSHYLSSSRELAQQLENELLQQMIRSCGIGLSGHLPTLVWLELQYQLSTVIVNAATELPATLQQSGHPHFLWQLHQDDSLA